ncbi:MAG: sensor histidine kinase, partial [Candidatus Hodarchaeales archaeon]
KEENKELRRKLDNCKIRLTFLKEFEYFIQNFVEKEDIDTNEFLREFLLTIQSLTGGNPSIVVFMHYSWEKCTVNEPFHLLQYNWKNFYSKQITDTDVIVFPYDIYPKGKNCQKEIEKLLLEEKKSVNNLLILRLGHVKPQIYLQIENITLPEYIDRYIKELNEFIYPISFLLKISILYDQMRKNLEEKYLLFDLLFHDLRNYIGFSILALSSLAKTSEKNRTIELLEKHLNKANNLISKIEYMTFIEASDYQLQPFNFYRIILTVIKVIENQFQNEKIEITIDPEAEPKQPILLVDHLFSEAINNLISNSVKYNEATIKKIEITWRPWEQDNSYLHIRISDNGIGIPDSEKMKVFRRFETSTLTKEKKKGLGLGLNIVLRLITRYQGYIWFENRIEDDFSKGSVVNLCTPQVKQ